MQGSMRERSPGVWELRVYVGIDPLTGVKRTVSRTFRGGKREAAKALSKLSADLDDPVQKRKLAPAKITLTQLLDDHLQNWEGSATTKATYRSMLNKHIVPTIGRLPLSELDTRLLERFFRWLRDEQGLSASSVKSVQSFIRGALRQAVAWGWLNSNPARDARTPARQRTDIELPDAERLAAGLEQLSADDPAFGCFIRLAAATGARRGELCGLRWSDIDLKARSVRIDSAVISTTETGVLEQDTKTHNARTVTLDPKTVAELRRHLASMRARASDTRIDLGADSFVFSHEADGARCWRPDNVSTKWDRQRDRLGLAGVRLHDLRHFQATMLLRAGVPVKNVSKRLGHRNAATTFNVYAQYVEGDDHTAAGVIGQLLSAPTRRKRASASS